MPYITQFDREHYIDAAVDAVPQGTTGWLNYAITRLCLRFVGQRKSYDLYNAIVGVLECVKLEFYRRAVAAYEDEKCNENGDVYGQ